MIMSGHIFVNIYIKAIAILNNYKKKMHDHILTHLVMLI